MEGREGGGREDERRGQGKVEQMGEKGSRRGKEGKEMEGGMGRGGWEGRTKCTHPSSHS